MHGMVSHRLVENISKTYICYMTSIQTKSTLMIQKEKDKKPS